MSKLETLTRGEWADQLKRLAQHLHTITLACPTCRQMNVGDAAQCPDCTVPFHLSDVIDSYADRVLLEEKALDETQGATGMMPVPEMSDAKWQAARPDLIVSRSDLNGHGSADLPPGQGPDLRNI